MAIASRGQRLTHIDFARLLPAALSGTTTPPGAGRQIAAVLGSSGGPDNGPCRHGADQAGPSLPSSTAYQSMHCSPRHDFLKTLETRNVVPGDQRTPGGSAFSLVFVSVFFSAFCEIGFDASALGSVVGPGLQELYAQLHPRAAVFRDLAVIGWTLITSPLSNALRRRLRLDQKHHARADRPAVPTTTGPSNLRLHLLPQAGQLERPPDLRQR